jgi:hypothetical protein
MPAYYASKCGLGFNVHGHRFQYANTSTTHESQELKCAETQFSCPRLTADLPTHLSTNECPSPSHSTQSSHQFAECIYIQIANRMGFQQKNLPTYPLFHPPTQFCMKLIAMISHDNYYSQFCHPFLWIDTIIDSFHWSGNSSLFQIEFNEFMDRRQ